MLNFVRQWHWRFLHTTLGIPDQDHAEPHAPLAVTLRSHPEVTAHRHHHTHTNPSLQSQLARERSRQPRVLKSWQLSIAALFERQAAQLRVQSGETSDHE